MVFLNSLPKPFSVAVPSTLRFDMWRDIHGLMVEFLKLKAESTER